MAQGQWLQAFKQGHAGREAASQGFKLQAQVYKRQDPGARVQAHKPLIQAASNQDKSIFFMLNME